ncbi:hypothetical protein BBP40_001902 [Aspergillus hancockii]|nr:hypothetical protein BBP40_001902 [Aspergillus hancockii]
MFSPVQLSRFHSVMEPSIDIRTGVSGESSRALEMIVQAYWIECFEARIAVLRLENPNLSAMEVRMMGLKEACAVLNWKEKDLRNRIAIWRGYKEIKDAGGWASLIFASAGVYRFCKYRTGFGDGFSTRLRHIRSSLEVAADTLHPEWRDLLQVIGQREGFDRGTAIGEFTGLITKGIEGVDVMLGGTRTRTYQIFQGQMGNFTRFINHSFQKQRNMSQVELDMRRLAQPPEEAQLSRVQASTDEYLTGSV